MASAESVKAVFGEVARRAVAHRVGGPCKIDGSLSIARVRGILHDLPWHDYVRVVKEVMAYMRDKGQRMLVSGAYAIFFGSWDCKEDVVTIGRTMPQGSPGRPRASEIMVMINASVPGFLLHTYNRMMNLWWISYNHDHERVSDDLLEETARIVTGIYKGLRK